MTELTPGATIGFVGLGNMGTPMAARLIDAGYSVAGYDPDQAARDRLTEHGGTAAPSLEALAEVDAVILMLPNSAIVHDVLIDRGLAEALRPGTIVIDMSSSEPLATRVVAEALAEHGVRMIDAPVSGGVKGAINGTLTIMVGGSRVDVAAATGLLETLGRPRHVGDIGAGHALKALNNLLSATHLWVTSEAMIAGERFGLDPAVMLEAINGSSGASGSTSNKWPNFILPGTYNSGFGLRLMLKDMKIGTDLARAVGAPIELGDTAVALWSEAAEGLPPTADHTEVARWLSERPEAPVAPAKAVPAKEG